jgi:hypothetical protein
MRGFGIPLSKAGMLESPIICSPIAAFSELGHQMEISYLEFRHNEGVI